MVTVRVAYSHAEALGTLYERACKLQGGFSDRYKVTMARLMKNSMKPMTIERLLEGIEAVLSANGMSDGEARTLDAIRLELRRERAHRRDGNTPVDGAVASAIAARNRLIAAGMPEPALPALEPGERFVASAGQVIAAVHGYLGARCTADRLADWVARAAQLASQAGDRFTIEEAARLVVLTCRWAAERFVQDEDGGTLTLTGPLVDPAVPGALAVAHLEAMVALDRMVYRPPEVAGELSFARAWLTRCQFAYHVVATSTLGRVLGYVAALPMTLADVLAVLRSGDDAHVSHDRLATCAPGDRVCVYIPSVVVRGDCDRIAVKNELRRSFLDGVRWLRDRGVEIEEVLAVGYTENGRSLLDEHGFVPARDLEARLGPSNPLFGGARRLYRLARHAAPPRVFGAMLRSAVFG